MAFDEIYSAPSIPLPRQEEIRIAVVKNGNKYTVDVRKWYTNDQDEMAPGKGIHLPSNVMEQIVASIQDAKKHLPVNDEDASANGKSATPAKAPAKKAVKAPARRVAKTTK